MGVNRQLPAFAPQPRVPARRPGLLYRFIQFVVIPLAALATVVWGLYGTEAAVDWGERAIDRVRGVPSGSTMVAGGSVPATLVASPTAVTAAPATPTATATPSSTATAVATVAPTAESTAVEVEGCVVPGDPPPLVDGAWETSGTVDLRAGPGLSCEVIDELPANTSVAPRGVAVRADGVGWQLVEVDGVAGWVYAALVEPSDEEGTAAPSPTAATVANAEPCDPPVPLPPVRESGDRTVTGPLNLREGPATSCGIVRLLPPGTEVEPRSGEYFADGRAWMLVEVDGADGWVATEYLQPAGDD